MEVIFPLLSIILGLFIFYMLIKTAVKHAIKESLEDIQLSIKSSLMERDWDKKND